MKEPPEMTITSRYRDVDCRGNGSSAEQAGRGSRPHQGDQRRLGTYLAPVVFTGISISRDEAERLITAEVRPPIKRGDLDQLSVERVVAIIDGELGEDLVIPIEEVRRALDRGVAITGAASVGALRAYEARTRGMAGTGWVYEAYCGGQITGIDEIAVLYAPNSYRPLTIPLVNIRYWLAQLRRERAIQDSDVTHAMTTLKELKVAERDGRTILLRLAAVFGRSGAKELLRRAKLAESDIKRMDACRLLRSLDPRQTRSLAHQGRHPMGRSGDNARQRGCKRSEQQTVKV